MRRVLYCMYVCTEVVCTRYSYSLPLMALSMHFNCLNIQLDNVRKYKLAIVAWNVMWKCNLKLSIRYGRCYVLRITQYGSTLSG